jgi:hypothetical protein
MGRTEEEGRREAEICPEEDRFLRNRKEFSVVGGSFSAS